MSFPSRLRWHRLFHATGHWQVAAGPDLAQLTDLKWRLARQGIQTYLVADWLVLSEEVR